MQILSPILSPHSLAVSLIGFLAGFYHRIHSPNSLADSLAVSLVDSLADSLGRFYHQIRLPDSLTVSLIVSLAVLSLFLLQILSPGSFAVSLIVSLVVSLIDSLTRFYPPSGKKNSALCACTGIQRIERFQRYLPLVNDGEEQKKSLTVPLLLFRKP